MFQNEWDALMLETFTLKKHLDTTRQQLSQALYQHDAACRVIARLQRERDQARAAVQSARESEAHASKSSDVITGRETHPFPPLFLSALESQSVQLSAARKNRKKLRPKTLAKKDDIAAFKETSSHSIHKTSRPGITCLALHSTKETLVLTGGADHDGKLFDTEKGKVVATLSGHKKKINAVAFAGDLLATASVDKTAAFWAPKSRGSGYTRTYVVTEHSASVVGVAVHPVSHFAVTVASDGSLCYHDIAAKTCLASASEATGTGFACAKIHPDGLLFGVGTVTGQFQMWDTRVPSKAAVVLDAHTGSTLSIAFSENGSVLHVFIL